MENQYVEEAPIEKLMSISNTTTTPAAHYPQAVEKLTWRNVWVILQVSFGSMAYGMAAGTISTTLGQPSFLLYFGFLTVNSANEPLINTSLLAATSGLFFAGGFFGFFIQGWIADRWGRKMCLLIGASITIVSAALTAGSVNIAMFLVFRLFIGFGSTQMLGTVPLLLAEVAPPHTRGFAVGVHSVSTTIGYVLAAWLGVAFYFVENTDNQWRIPLAVSGIPSIIMIIVLKWIPESPRWLIVKGRKEEAKQIIAKLHGGDSEMATEFALLEIDQMTKQIEFERANDPGWFAFLTEKRFRKRVILATVTMVMSQSAGAVVINNYSATIYRGLGYSTVAQLCLAAAYLTDGLVVNVLSALYIDRMGRVLSTKIGTILQIVLLIIATALISNFADSTNLAADKALTAIFFLFSASFAGFTEGPSYTYAAEIFPVYLRAKGLTVAFGGLFVIDTVYLSASLYAFTTVGWKFYLVFIIVPIVLLAIFWVLAKETKGRSLEEVAALFGDELVVKTLSEQISAEKDHSLGDEKPAVV